LFLPVALSLLARSVLAVPALVTGTALPPQITQQAGGGLPNTPGTPHISNTAIAAFQLANFLENLESAFFQEGFQNYTTWGTTGAQINGVNNMNVVGHIAAQEEVHVAAIAGLLQGNGAQSVAPCQYNFPVTDETSFFALGNIITTVGIGALIGLQDSLSTTDPELMATVGSILPVESRHDAFFRMTAGEIPNPTVFETEISGAWAYNLGLDFTVAGSCPNLPSSITSLPVFPDLGIVGYGGPSFATPNSPGKLIFQVGQPSMLPQGWNSGALYMAWVNQDNVPAYTPVTVDQNQQLHADVQPGMFGIAFAALTNQNTATNINDLTKATLAGPIPIPLT